ncbi:hypothetical protein PT7_2212 [Pusillimonas sp. T7-7]|uniref:DUF4917 family protein n=1 Tax=Pusillimonas sp. (strain T7-7) TaxID=1007105 RepID=UPI000208542C|nr:DUF4917 family protein [Pusillimonas sp. T7-7]AEC20752.1 hypothetical protein PT7_2212 [Pusillimonas sp. T7-7]
MPDVVDWKSLQPQFQDGLLLGNGASIAVHAGFGYADLYEKSQELGYITPAVQGIFASFGTTDFELVLLRLWQAKLVNEALRIPPGRVEQAYNEVRTALIATVRATHVTYEEATPHLIEIYRFMHQFKTVASLNYDLIVYWAALVGNDNLGRWFKDAFNGGTFHEDWKSLRRPYRANGTTLFFYPHGNLVLSLTSTYSEEKISRGDPTNLLEAILEQWKTGTRTPIFVCEGTADNKKKSIERSSYLRTINREVLPHMGESLAIYGWSLAEQDEHIIKQVLSASLQRIAVSVHNNDMAFAKRTEEMITRYRRIPISFFHASSSGCWNNPVEQEG